MTEDEVRGQYHFCPVQITIHVRGLFQNYPEKDYNFFNINGIHLKFYMPIEQFISNIFNNLRGHEIFI